jgi:hypothetical protein
VATGLMRVVREVTTLYAGCVCIVDHATAGDDTTMGDAKSEGQGQGQGETMIGGRMFFDTYRAHVDAKSVVQAGDAQSVVQVGAMSVVVVEVVEVVERERRVFVEVLLRRQAFKRWV